jgi:4-hydroxy-tetrahydrodipicolinate synthase
MSQTNLHDLLDGVFVPMFTPFTADGKSIDEAQLRANVGYLLDQGIRLPNPAGTTGEFWTLRPDEHRRLVQVVTQEARTVSPDALVIAGASAANTQAALEFGRFAVQCGCRIVLLTPPFYLPCSEEDVLAHYRAVSEQLDAAIMLYEIVPATGVRLRGDLLARICDSCPNVVALKTGAAADAPREFERLVRRFGQRLRVFSGTGLYYAPFTYMTGVAGITDTLGNAFPQFGLTIHRLARRRQWEELNNLYQDAFEVLEIELLYGKAGLKEIGHVMGVVNGVTRFPLTTSLSDADRADIRRRLERWQPPIGLQDTVQRTTVGFGGDARVAT